MSKRLFPLASLIISTVAVAVSERRATVCNGHAELCSRSYGNVTFLTSHDSFAVSRDPVALARAQEVDLTSQMNLGVRALQAQSHMHEGVLHFCHTSCSLFNGGTVLAYLQTVKSFMDSNPNEVFTFIFTNPEGASPKNVWDPIFQQSGIASMVYTPPHLPMKASEWPTLGEMIDSGKRVVVFMDYSTNTADVPYILPEFENVWETPFDPTNTNFPCTVDRISGPLSSQDHMFMINHNLNARVFFDHSLTLPDYIHASTTNSIASITANSNGCAPYSGGRAANFVLLDFVNIGDGMAAVNILNGLA